MTISEKLDKINTIKGEIKTVLADNGVEVGDKFAEYPEAINHIKDNVLEFDPDTMQLKPLTTIIEVKGDSAIAKAAKYATDMNACFNDCRALTSVSLPELPNVTVMASFFAYCSALTSISLPELPKVTNMQACFQSCTSLTSINLSELPKVTNMSSCFQYCRSLKSISLPALPNVTNMSSCFSSCTSLTSINLSELPNVKNIGNCFFGCTSLTSISLPELPKVTNMSSCFSGCSALESLTIGALNTALSNLSTCYLSSCTKLTVDSLLNVFNALPQRTGTNKLTIGTTNLNKLTDEQKAIATGKGWTLN